MEVKLIAFGIARDILKNKSVSFQMKSGNTIGDLKKMIISEYPAFSALSKLSFAVGEEYQEENFVIPRGAEVVIIPPVSGG